MNEQKKVAIYVRNSTTEEKQNPDNQIRPLVAYCDRMEHKYKIFQEFASGMKESRPELDKMLQLVRRGFFDIVLVWRIDRLGRSLKHLLQLIEEFKHQKVIFISLTESFDTGTPQGELFFQIAGAFAQFERRLIQERINAGLARAKALGHPIGRQKGAKDRKPRKKSGYYLRYKKKHDKYIDNYSDLEFKGGNVSEEKR